MQKKKETTGYSNRKMPYLTLKQLKEGSKKEKRKRKKTKFHRICLSVIPPLS